MADPAETGTVEDHGAANHDGRFGKRFDDEVSVPGIIWITFGLAVACSVGMLITWGMQNYYEARAQAVYQPSPVAEANERRLPEGPLLQADPEAELEAMRHEMAERLGGYGWVDEGTGVVRIPIDQAMDLLVDQAATVSADREVVGDAAAAEAAE